MDEFLSNWKEIVLGILIPTITSVIMFYKWLLPSIKKCQQVQKLIDVNTIMEVMAPFLEEIDARLQILARSSTTLAESQKIVANEIGFISAYLSKSISVPYDSTQDKSTKRE